MKLAIDNVPVVYTVAEIFATNDPDCLIAITLESGAVAVCKSDRPQAFALLMLADLPVTPYAPTGKDEA